MTPKRTDVNAVADAHEIARLVNRARTEGEPDHFSGKRRWTRYKLGLRLEITTGTGRPEETWGVTMHNISGGGFGFWSRRPLNEYDQVFVREWSETEPTEWLPACITHCTVGLQGYLIGARFENACPAGEQWELNTPVTVIEHAAAVEAKADSLSLRDSSLRVKCAFAVASASCAAAGAMACVHLWVPSESDGAWQLMLAVLVATVIVGALFGAMMFRREARFLSAIRSAVVHMVVRGHQPPELASAPTKELIALRQAFLELAGRWQRWEEDEREQRHRLEELSQMKSNILSIVSHDLRTPLTSILLYAEMLKDDLENLARDDQQHFLDIIANECNRLSRLVDDLLEVQRLESDRVRWNMQVQDLSGTIRACAHVFEAMAAGKNIEFIVEVPRTLPPTEADADKISQVVSNLLSNAIKYTPTLGKVRLFVEARSSNLLIRVTDTGPGIPRQKWDRLFDRFSQLGDPNVTQIDGFGLGLYIVKRIVESHGGVAWLDSEVGKGSEFCVSLPIRTDAASTLRDYTQPPTAGSVLICDPDPELAALLAQTLRLSDFDARVCHSGARLLSLLTQCDVDVVVTEVLLPDIDAQQILAALRQQGRRSFRVIVHSYADCDATHTWDGVDVFLQRPVLKEDLVAAVRSVLGRDERAKRRIVVVTGGADEMHTLGSRFDREGHEVEILDSIVDAAVQTRQRPADALVLPEQVLGESWQQVIGLFDAAAGRPDVFIICQSVRKRERRLAEQNGVTPLVYRPGLELEVISKVAGQRVAREPESVS
jgi:signal transduction histidine kinase/CheY-like chemotaxis protein